MSESSSNLTRSLTKVKSKLSSKFKNTAVNSGAEDHQVDPNELLAMKYDDLPKEEEANESEMKRSISFTNISTISESMERDQIIDPIVEEEDDQKLLPPASVSTNSISTLPLSIPNNETTETIKEKEFAFLQQQSSNPTSPNPLRRNDSIVDPLSISSSISEKLIPLISPQPITQTISVSSTGGRRKSSNISTNSLSISQPVTPTNETPSIRDGSDAENLEFADAMALSILDKVDEIKIEQGETNTDEWRI